jgi:hypothetical protein
MYGKKEARNRPQKARQEEDVLMTKDVEVFVTGVSLNGKVELAKGSSNDIERPAERDEVVDQKAEDSNSD